MTLPQVISCLMLSVCVKNEATDIFDLERTKDSIAGIIGNVMQSFGDKELYVTSEIVIITPMHFHYEDVSALVIYVVNPCNSMFLKSGLLQFCYSVLSVECWNNGNA